MVDDPTHAQTHQDKMLSSKEYLQAKYNYLFDKGAPKIKSGFAEMKVRNDISEPWRHLVGKRIGDTFHMIGIYQPGAVR